MTQTEQAASDRATWPAKEVGNVMACWRRGVGVVVTEAETLALLEKAMGPNFVQFTFGARPVRMLPHERCEWAFRALAEMRGERTDGAAA